MWKPAALTVLNGVRETLLIHTTRWLWSRRMDCSSWKAVTVPLMKEMQAIPFRGITTRGLLTTLLIRAVGITMTTPLRWRCGTSRILIRPCMPIWMSPGPDPASRWTSLSWTIWPGEMVTAGRKLERRSRFISLSQISGSR